MSEIKLLPCPFCGGEAHIEEHKFWDEKAKGFTVQTYGVVCDNCCSMSWQHHRHKEKAIEQWNTRKPMERIKERLENEMKIFKGGVVQEACFEFGVEKAIDMVKEEGGTSD